MDVREIIKNTLRSLFRDRNFTFWVLLFPLMLMTFFTSAFSGLATKTEDLHIPVAIEKGSFFNFIAPSIEILEVKEIKVSPENDLKNKDIKAFIDKDLNIMVTASGTEEAIVKSILDQVKQMIAMGKMPSAFDMEKSYVDPVRKTIAPWMLPVLSLLALFTTYASGSGIDLTEYIQASRTPLAVRINTSSVKKFHLIVIYTLTNLLVYIFCNVLILLYLRFVLNVKIITDFPRTLLIMTVGSLVGLSFGLFIGLISNKGASFKSLVTTMFSLFLAYLSGMMNFQTKGEIETAYPILGKINPVALITTEIMKVNALGDRSSYYQALLILFGFFLVLTLISSIFLRRMTYDSL